MEKKRKWFLATINGGKFLQDPVQSLSSVLEKEVVSFKYIITREVNRTTSEKATSTLPMEWVS